MAKLHLISLGCNKNLVDSEIMLGRLKDYDLTDDASNADVLIVNTCGFIGPAKQESLQTIFNLHETRKKDSLLVATGCFIERYKDDLTIELPEVDLFCGVGDYNIIDELIEKKESRFSSKTYLQTSEERIITGSTSHAYIKLSEGCNQKCSFCAIPNFKGKLQSRPINDIVNEIKGLIKKGFYDFSFIAQDSSSYLRDTGEKEGLIKLIHEIEEINGVKSARILYLYPTTTSNELIDKIIESKIFHNYFDMPIQHINEEMLKIMKRGANKKRIKELLTKMRNAPNSFLRTGLIIGHPGESQEHFFELLSFIDEFEFDRINVFAYCDEEDTLAYEMKNKIENEIVEERLENILPKIKNKLSTSLEKEVGKEIAIITEGDNNEHELFIGARKISWAPQIDGEILINDTEIENLEVGKMYLAKITQRIEDKIFATVIKSI